jgi:hypothetical protein
MIGDQHAYVVEISEIDPIKQTLTMKSRNVTLADFMIVNEHIVYKSDPLNPHRHEQINVPRQQVLSLNS